MAALSNCLCRSIKLTLWPKKTQFSFGTSQSLIDIDTNDWVVGMMRKAVDRWMDRVLSI